MKWSWELKVRNGTPTRTELNRTEQRVKSLAVGHKLNKAADELILNKILKHWAMKMAALLIESFVCVAEQELSGMCGMLTYHTLANMMHRTRNVSCGANLCRHHG